LTAMIYYDAQHDIIMMHTCGWWTHALMLLFAVGNGTSRLWLIWAGTLDPQMYVPAQSMYAILKLYAAS